MYLLQSFLVQFWCSLVLYGFVHSSFQEGIFSAFSCSLTVVLKNSIDFDTPIDFTLINSFYCHVKYFNIFSNVSSLQSSLIEGILFLVIYQSCLLKKYQLQYYLDQILAPLDLTWS